MKRAVIIGGKGKVGTYLVPMLCENGYEVINVSRGSSNPYLEHGCWKQVQQVSIDRADPAFAETIADLKPDVVVDMICFTLEDMKKLVSALNGVVSHYLVCGSVWVHGSSTCVPYSEEQDLTPFGEYGIQKLAMTREIERLYATTGFPGTVVHPGHIVGPGHLPLNPQANKNTAVFEALIHGRPVALPNLGMETIHHVHAEDVAGVFFAAIQAGSVSFGQAFHAVSPGALTLRGYAQAVAGWFGQTANLQFLPYEEWKNGVSPQEAAQTLEHILHAPNASMEKAKRLLGFVPRHSSLSAVREALDYMLAHGMIH